MFSLYVHILHRTVIIIKLQKLSYFAIIAYHKINYRKMHRKEYIIQNNFYIRHQLSLD